jgi:hypothetical protein
MKSFKEYIIESKEASDKEYYDALYKFFYNEFKKVGKSEKEFKEFFNLVLKSDNFYSSTGKTFVYKSDSGNFIAKWTVDESTIYLHGIVTLNGKIVKGDVPDIRKWKNEIMNKLNQGYTLLTTPHSVTENMLQQLCREAEKDGKHLSKKTINSHSFGGSPFLNYKTIEISLD